MIANFMHSDSYPMQLFRTSLIMTAISMLALSLFAPGKYYNGIFVKAMNRIIFFFFFIYFCSVHAHYCNQIHSVLGQIILLIHSYLSTVKFYIKTMYRINPIIEIRLFRIFIIFLHMLQT